MKSFILFCLILVSGFTYAENSALIATSYTPANGEIRTQMQAEQLPEGVTRTLEGARFTGWKPVVVYKVESGADRFYEITFVREQEIINLKVNEQGGKIG